MGKIKRKWTAEERRQLAAGEIKGNFAGPDQSYPIAGGGRRGRRMEAGWSGPQPGRSATQDHQHSQEAWVDKRSPGVGPQEGGGS